MAEKAGLSERRDLLFQEKIPKNLNSQISNLSSIFFSVHLSFHRLSIQESADVMEGIHEGFPVGGVDGGSVSMLAVRFG